MSLLNVENIRKSYGKTEVLKDISFSLKKGEVLAIIGSSGSGKTTLLRCLNFLETPGNGKISVNDKVLFDSNDSSAKSDSEIRKRRLHFGLVFQSFNLFPQYTVIENIMLAPKLAAKEQIKQTGEYMGAKSYKEAHEIIKSNAKSLLERVGLSEKSESYPCNLSGGQQQRVAIARALALNPDVLCFDEPTSALDPELTGVDMQMELKEMHKSLGITFVYVTHDQEEALTLSDTIVVMSEGKIQQIGTPIDIYNEPINSFVANFIGESNILNGTMIHDKLVRFCGTEFECVDEGFGENTPVDVVIRPEDLYIFPVSDMAQLTGVVQTSIFKGVHYEMTVLCGGYEFLVQDYHHFEVGAEVGLLVKPFDIHIMKKERGCNTFEGKLLDTTHVEFLGCNFECVPVEGIESNEDVKVEVDFDKVVLQDNEEDGTLTGEVKFILYKGDHYHLTVFSDWDENVFVDTNDVWDDGDRVGITIPPDAIRVIKITD